MRRDYLNQNPKALANRRADCRRGFERMLLGDSQFAVREVGARLNFLLSTIRHRRSRKQDFDSRGR